MVTATIDLDSVRSQRAAFSSRCEQSATNFEVPAVSVDFVLGSGRHLLPTPCMNEIRIHHPMEEIALGPACWLWDYLRRSAQGGFFIALSGGADSASVAAIVGSMCQMVVKEVAVRKLASFRSFAVCGLAVGRGFSFMKVPLRL